jgi:hypothetical protein
MHSGFYGADGADVEKDPQEAQHDMMEELLAFSGVKREKVEPPPPRARAPRP